MTFMFLHHARASMYSFTQNKKMITIYLKRETRQKAKVFGWMYAIIKALLVPMRSDSLSKKTSWSTPRVEIQVSDIAFEDEYHTTEAFNVE